MDILHHTQVTPRVAVVAQWDKALSLGSVVVKDSYFSGDSDFLGVFNTKEQTIKAAHALSHGIKKALAE